MFNLHFNGFTKGFKKGDRIFEVLSQKLDEETGIFKVYVRPLDVQAAGKKKLLATEICGDFTKREFHNDGFLFATLLEAAAYVYGGAAQDYANDSLHRIIICTEASYERVLPQYRNKVGNELAHLKSIVPVVELHYLETLRNCHLATGLLVANPTQINGGDLNV